MSAGLLALRFLYFLPRGVAVSLENPWVNLRNDYADRNVATKDKKFPELAYILL